MGKLYIIGTNRKIPKIGEAIMGDWGLIITGDSAISPVVPRQQGVRSMMKREMIAMIA
jgi:hypothetical protein